MSVLAQLASWDVTELRGGVGRLDQVAGRLVPWRLRLDELGRRLGTAECWSGPAGEAAAAALVELSSATSVLSGALDSSVATLWVLGAAAADAQELAAAALAAADAVGVGLDDSGRAIGLPDPPALTMAPDQVAAVAAVRQGGQRAGQLATDALAAAARATGCARDAQLPPNGLDLADPPGAGTWQARPPQPPPPAGRPGAAAAWWAGLTAGEQLLELAALPTVLGALDGLPGWARDRANRALLATALRELPVTGEQRETAGAVAAVLAAEQRAGRPVQLVQFDLAAGLVAVGLGDVDTAAAIAVLVPGINTTPADDLAGLVGQAAAVGAAAGAAAPATPVAVVAWLGYRTPGLLGAVSLAAARRGGPALDGALDGLAAARAVPGGPAAPRVTVVAHSYGSVVTGQAARAPGRLAADAVVLLGSPGTSVGRADRLEAAEVHGAWSAADPVSTSDFYGASPYDPRFGDLPLPVGPGEGHTDYLDPDRPTLAAIGEVVAGTRAGG